jgi:hypothetical protein
MGTNDIRKKCKKLNLFLIEKSPEEAKLPEDDN